LFVAANNVAGGHKSRFAVVRYGNVVGSRGSVVPLFKKVIEDGGDHLPITDERMTRFWITLSQGVAFVLKAFERMQGGEILVPKIPSVRVVDVAAAMAPGLRHEIIGIRPGEKLHETMCPTEASYLTLEFDDHFVIKPSISFAGPVDFSVNRLGEIGRLVDEGFGYHSNTNGQFLDVDGINELNRLAGVT
jgi:UDP-N-acetylglucosamine 4,6-dehydratase